MQAKLLELDESQEVINWDPRSSKGQTLKGKPNLYSLKTISRSLERLQGSKTMVPTQVAFEAVNTADSHASESDLDAAVTVHAVEKEVRCPAQWPRDCKL